MKGKQSVSKGVWYTGRQKRKTVRIYTKERGRGFPIGILASAAASFLHEVVKPI